MSESTTSLPGDSQDPLEGPTGKHTKGQLLCYLHLGLLLLLVFCM